MRNRFVPCASVALCLCLILALPAFPQTSSGGFGPTTGEIIKAIAVVATVVGGVALHHLHETHKHPTITGCFAANADGLSLTDEKDRKVYALSGNLATLQAGERVAIRGEKVKVNDAAEKQSFQVQRLTKDLGACLPVARPRQ
jgi:hypothetical protein